MKFGDLDISTSKGAAALYDRTQTAAVDVCSRMYVIEQAYRLHKDACSQKVIGDAVIKVNRPGCPLSSHPYTACHRRWCWPRQRLASAARAGCTRPGTLQDSGPSAPACVWALSFSAAHVWQSNDSFQARMFARRTSQSGREPPLSS